jgi:aryl sulfotransferase
VHASPTRRYRGFFADSGRWERFALRPGDVIITAPSKCGTTWMQHIVGMLLLDRSDLGVPISTLSPWLDMQTRTEAEVFALLEAQDHRRFIKSHTPLDGLPADDDVTYVAVIRHPLDVALSDRDHRANTDELRARKLRLAATGSLPEPAAGREAEPDEPGAYLRWFIDNDIEPTGSGPYGLADYCHQARTYWEARGRPNVHLFHYSDLWTDLAGEMRRVADALGVTVAEDRWADVVAAAGLDAMRHDAAHTAPEAEVGLWRDPTDFFRQGGTREWASLLGTEGVAHFHRRLEDLAGDATGWILRGRTALASDGLW